MMSKWNCKGNRLTKFLCFLLVLICLVNVNPQKVSAANITACSVTFYTKPATPCFSRPDLTSGIILYLDKYLPVNVTGFTDNQFFRVDIGTVVYIPVPFLSQSLHNKTESQITNEQITDYANAYKIQLEQLATLSKYFGLQDVNGDGFPELVTDNDQIFTYYNKKPAMAYYSTYPCTLYYDKADNRLVGKFTKDSVTNWEIYTYSTVPLPSGYFTCTSTNVSPYESKLVQIQYPFENDEDTRGELFDHLYHLLGHADLCSTCKKYYD